MLSDSHIVKFQKLFKAQFGEELTREQAVEKAEKLLGIVRLVHRPIKRRKEFAND